MKPTITIEYCPKCNWLARAAWMSQELLTTFNEELEGHVCEVALAIGYHKDGEDWNNGLPKARLSKEKIITIL